MPIEMITGKAPILKSTNSAEPNKKGFSRMWILFFLTALLLLIGILRLLYSSKEFQNLLKSQQASLLYNRQPALFSPAERSFLGVLDQVLGSKYRVFGKVRIADLIEPENGAGRQDALNRIVGKHVDFVVCDANNLSIIGVIELDDKSHNEDSRQKRDVFVDMVFASAGIPITRFPAQTGYNLSVIRESIQRSFDLVLNERVKASTPLKLVVQAKVTSLCDFNNHKDPDTPENKR